jgi:pyruvyltransferase
MTEVQVLHWNPRANLVGERLPVRRRMNNFGDLLGPLVAELLTGVGVRRAPNPNRPQPGPRLLTVGSILHYARDGDCIWGTGARGDGDPRRYAFTTLDVRAVRGPRTRALLTDRGIPCPEIYGDPALLLPELMPQLSTWAQEKTRAVTIVPNYADFPAMRAEHGARCLDPRGGVRACLRAIAQSEAVIASSLHGLIVAESLGIPARLLSPAREAAFKYEDYYLGTGREPVPPAVSVAQALRELGPEGVPVRADPALRDAFPHDLWSAEVLAA